MERYPSAEAMYDQSLRPLYDTKAREVMMNTIEPGRYRHYKGSEYEVIGVARHSETYEELVVYRPLYGERGLWVRPKAMFTEMVMIEGKDVRRFERIDEATEK